MMPPSQPCLEKLDNQTGLAVLQYDQMGPGRVFHDVVAVKASFSLSPDGLSSVPVAGRLCRADRHHNLDDVVGSSLAQADDLILGKPGADVFVTGTARTARPARRWIAQVEVRDRKVGEVLARYACIATGPSRWQHHWIGGWALSEPAEANCAPVLYELAWGGRRRDAGVPPEQWKRHGLNPCGSGYSFEGYSHSDEPVGLQWVTKGIFSSNDRQLTRFGPVARFWDSRKRYAGTYDAAWRKRFDAGEPDYPPDFDMRFFQCAHPALQTAQPLRGDEVIALMGLLPVDDTVSARLPGYVVEAALDATTLTLPLDTVHVDLDNGQIHLVWRLALAQSLGIERVRLDLKRG